jgi:hypothetical protein
MAVGHIDRLDETVKWAELAPAITRSSTHWFSGPVDLRCYNADHLKEIYSGAANLPVRIFLGVIFQQGGHILDRAIVVIAHLAAIYGDPTQDHRTFDTVKAEHERGVPLSVGDLVEFTASWRNRSGLRELRDQKIALIGFAACFGSPIELADTLSRIMFSAFSASFQYTTIEAATLLGKIIET